MVRHLGDGRSRAHQSKGCPNHQQPQARRPLRAGLNSPRAEIVHQSPVCRRARDGPDETAVAAFFSDRQGSEASARIRPSGSVNWSIPRSGRARRPSTTRPPPCRRSTEPANPRRRRVERPDRPTYGRRGHHQVKRQLRGFGALLVLALTEIIRHGANAPQVVGRLHAVLDELKRALPAERHAAVRRQRELLEATVATVMPVPLQTIPATPDRERFA